MRDEQIRRYARHILLPDVGGIGQEALLSSSARIAPGEPAARVAAMYLAAGGVAIGDTGREVTLPPRPAWWPASAGDATALAYWRGGLAATLWMAAVTAGR